LENFLLIRIKKLRNSKKGDTSKIVAKRTIKSSEISFNIENSTFDFNEIKATSAHLEIMWKKKLT